MSFYTEFLSDSKKQLEEGSHIYAFFKYQLDALVEHYKDNLQYRIDPDTGWYVCRLTKIPEKVIKPKTEVDPNKIRELRERGFPIKRIALTLGCSRYAVEKVLKGE